MLRIGLVSDTHGLLRPEVRDFLRGSDHIVHAGDICMPEVLDALAAIAPVTAVRGNNDRGAWADALPASATAAPAVSSPMKNDLMHASAVCFGALVPGPGFCGHRRRWLFGWQSGPPAAAAPSGTPATAPARRPPQVKHDDLRSTCDLLAIRRPWRGKAPEVAQFPLRVAHLSLRVAHPNDLHLFATT
jgi:hypothetical protein